MICCRIDLIRIHPAATTSTARSPPGSPSLLPHVFKVREVLVVNPVLNPPLQLADGLPLHQDGTLSGRLVIASGLGVARRGRGGGPGASCRAAAGTTRRLGMEGGQGNANAVPSASATDTTRSTGSTALITSGRENDARMRISTGGPKCQCVVEPAGACCQEEDRRGRRAGRRH